MPGVGKTYFGKYAAQKLGWVFIDLDFEIAQTYKLSIAQIFQKWGEAEFRKIEYEFLGRLIEQCVEPTLVATGGGLPCYNNNMNLINEKGKTVWIEASMDTIYQNIECDLPSRPMFKTTIKDKVIDELTKMYEQRKAFYMQSSLKVNVYRGYSPDLFTNTVHLSTIVNRG